MLLRLLLSLLIVALAAPAVAMPTCHASSSETTAPHSQQMAANGHHGAPADPDTPQPHGDPLCIGCVAPSTVRPPSLDTLPGPGLAQRHARATDGAPLNRFPPATPPPRHLG